jgi:hypothetical protein
VKKSQANDRDRSKWEKRKEDLDPWTFFYIKKNLPKGYTTVCLCVNTYTLRPKIFAPFDFYRTRLTIRLIQKICANVKTIMIYLKHI